MQKCNPNWRERQITFEGGEKVQPQVIIIKKLQLKRRIRAYKPGGNWRSKPLLV